MSSSREVWIPAPRRHEPTVAAPSSPRTSQPCHPSPLRTGASVTARTGRTTDPPAGRAAAPAHRCPAEEGPTPRAAEASCPEWRWREPPAPPARQRPPSEQSPEPVNPRPPPGLLDLADGHPPDARWREDVASTWPRGQAP